MLESIANCLTFIDEKEILHIKVSEYFFVLIPGCELIRISNVNIDEIFAINTKFKFANSRNVPSVKIQKGDVFKVHKNGNFLINLGDQSLLLMMLNQKYKFTIVDGLMLPFEVIMYDMEIIWKV